MPRAAKRRTNPSAHASAVPLKKRRFALPEGQGGSGLEMVVDGGEEAEEMDANEMLAAFGAGKSAASVFGGEDGDHDEDEQGGERRGLRPSVARKIKRDVKGQIRRQLEADAPSHPYSKSHARRAKRQAKQSLSVNLTSVDTALDSVLPDEHVPPTPSAAAGGAVVVRKTAAERAAEAEAEARKIGVKTGTAGPKAGQGLTTKRRQGILATERQRMPAVLAHPAFAADPFGAIRKHAKNTLVPLRASITGSEGGLGLAGGGRKMIEAGGGMDVER